MIEKPGFRVDDPVEELRLLVLSKAIERTVPTGYKGEDTIRLAHIFPHGEPSDNEEGFPYYRIATYSEDPESDGVIAMVSFEDYGIDEAHLTLSDEGMTYEEDASDGSSVAPTEVTQAMARQLLERLQLALR
jgi:hypothetical protein